MSAGPAVTLLVRKRGELRYLGHRDWARVLARALRRSGLPIRMTEGFHPHPKLSLPEPLPLGVASEGERFVVQLREERDERSVAEALAPELPAGMELRAVWSGAHREPLDVPVKLAVETAHPEALVAELPVAPEELAPLGLGSLEVLERSAPVLLRLCPPPGRRASIGRLLGHLRERGLDRPGWMGVVCRCCISADRP